MSKYCQICITASAETALGKLSRGKIPIYNLKKRGNRLYFEVSDEYLKKTFAIFSHTCYNINVIEKSKKGKLANFALTRLGLIVGCLIFVTSIFISNCFIFKINVTGSGEYLKNDVLLIASDAGIKIGASYNSFDKPLALSQIMALPNVTFCSIERSGSVVTIDVQTSSDDEVTLNHKKLLSDVNGTLRELVVICGNKESEVGQNVVKGQSLIGAYTYLSDGTMLPCLAVGYAVIECKQQLTYSAESESEQNKLQAIASIKLYTDDPLNVECKVKCESGGVVYEVTFSYLHTISINME